jgi:hypothetical protein
MNPIRKLIPYIINANNIGLSKTETFSNECDLHLLFTIHTLDKLFVLMVTIPHHFISPKDFQRKTTPFNVVNFQRKTTPSNVVDFQRKTTPSNVVDFQRKTTPSNEK